MLLENGLWRLRVYRLRLRSQSGWGAWAKWHFENAIVERTEVQKKLWNWATWHFGFLRYSKFQKKHIIEHELPLPAAMCFVRNHTGRLQDCQNWIPSCQYQQNLRLQIQNDQIFIGRRFFQAGRIAHIPQATQSCLWRATLGRKNFGKLTTRPRNKEDLKLETTEVSNLRLT